MDIFKNSIKSNLFILALFVILFGASCTVMTNITVLPWQYYSSEFYAPDNWVEIKLPFNSFKKSNFYQPNNFNSNDIRTLGIVAYGKDYVANLDVGLIEFY